MCLLSILTSPACVSHLIHTERLEICLQVQICVFIIRAFPVRRLAFCCFPPITFHSNWEIPEKTPLEQVHLSNIIWPQSDDTIHVVVERNILAMANKKSQHLVVTGPVSQHYHCVYLRLQSRRGTRFIYRIHHQYPVGFGAGIVTVVCCKNPWEFVFGLHLMCVLFSFLFFFSEKKERDTASVG